VFTRIGTGNTWDVPGHVKLVAPMPDDGDDFAANVSISGTRIAITEHDNDDVARNAGAVWIFTQAGATYGPPVRINASDFVAEHQFGRGGADIDGDRLVVAAYAESRVATRAGAIYVFEHGASAWNAGSKLTAPTPQASELFGRSVAIFGDRIVSGAPQSDVGMHSMAGRAYVFERGAAGWAHAATVVASDAYAYAQFGFDVDVHVDTLVIGAHRDGAAGDFGAAYVYPFTGGALGAETKLTQNPLVSNAHLGFTVATGNGAVLVGNDSAEPVLAY
jgi:hypothetical protein